MKDMVGNHYVKHLIIEWNIVYIKTGKLEFWEFRMELFMALINHHVGDIGYNHLLCGIYFPFTLLPEISRSAANFQNLIRVRERNVIGNP